MPRSITIQQLQPADNPADGWFIIEVPGDYPNTTTDGRRITQQIRAENIAAIVNNGVPPEGLPIDKDHLSMNDDNSTEAMGWVRELALCGHALAARIEWTALGLPLIQGKVYKHFSTVYPANHARCIDGAILKPERLIGLALTNHPNNQGAPSISNRAAAQRVSEILNPKSEILNPRPPSGNSAESGALPGAEPQTQVNTKPDMNPEILKALGLPEGATEEDVLSAIKELTQTAEDAQAAANAAAESEADQVIAAEEKAANTELDADEKQECKEQILANRKHGVNYTHLLCNSKRKPAPQGAPARRYEGKTPAVANRAENSREARVANRADEICREARSAGRSINYWTAKQQAEREIGKECK